MFIAYSPRNTLSLTVLQFWKIFSMLLKGAQTWEFRLDALPPCIGVHCVLFFAVHRVTQKTSGFKTSGFKTFGFKTSETSGLQNVRFAKRQVYKTSGLQNVRSSKRLVAKKLHIYSVLVVGGNLQVVLQPCLQAKWWLCFILYFTGFFAIYHHNK